MKKFVVSVLAFFLCMLSVSAATGNAPSYIAIESNSGKLLFSSNAEQKRPIAGLAQVATGMVALDWIQRSRTPLDTLITVPQQAFGMRAGNPMNLQPGDSLSLRDALYSTLLGSDNVTALTLAYFIGRDLAARQGGGNPVSLFVNEMNNLARALTMDKTNFAAPHGLDGTGSASISCAVDLALLGAYCMQNGSFAYIVSQRGRRIAVQSPLRGTSTYDLVNVNKLLGTPGVDGIKASSSRAAGPCLMVSAVRQAQLLNNPAGTGEMIFPQRMIIVVLGTDQRYTMANRILADGWKVWDMWHRQGMDLSDPKEFIQLPQRNTASSGSTSR